MTLGNFDVLIRELTRLYGNMRIWVTEYGYQTNPPDKVFGVTLAEAGALPAAGLGQARAPDPRVDVFIWFLLRDEQRVDAGWQSGIYTASGKRKPSRETFERLGT